MTLFEAKPKKWQCPDCGKWFHFNVPHFCIEKESKKESVGKNGFV